MLAFWIVGAAGAVLFLVSLLLGDVLDGVFDSLEGATGGLLSTAAVGGFASADFVQRVFARQPFGSLLPRFQKSSAAGMVSAPRQAL